MPVYKNTQRGTWYVSFYYRDYNGKNVRKKKEGFKTKREAQEFEQSYRLKMTGTGKVSFIHLSGEYLEIAKTKLKSSSLAGHTRVITAQLNPVFGEYAVRDISPLIIRKWINQALAQGLKPSTIRCYFNVLAKVLDCGEQYYGVPNAAKNMKFEVRSEKREYTIWTVEQFETFLKYIKPPLAHIAFEILFWTGIRKGELLALTIDDIDTENKVLHITKTLAYGVKGKPTQTPKTKASKRDVILPDFLNAELKEVIDRLPVKGDTPFYPHCAGNLNFHLERGAKLAGLPPIRVHDLRHSHASLLSSMRINPVDIAQRLGHADPATTMGTYSHAYEDAQAQVVSLLNEKIAEKSGE